MKDLALTRAQVSICYLILCNFVVETPLQREGKREREVEKEEEEEEEEEGEQQQHMHSQQIYTFTPKR